MKKLFYLLLFIAILPAAGMAQSNWVTKKIDNTLAVKFPSAPEKTMTAGGEVYITKEKDSTQYSASFLDLKLLANLDSAALAPLKENKAFADQLIKSIAAQKPKYTFGDVTIGKWKTFTAYYTSAIDKTTNATAFLKMIFIGSKLYSVTFKLPENLVTKNKEVFFNSVELLK